MARATNGSTVRALREAVGISGRDFASRAGISPAYLSNIENGRKQPTPSVTRRLASTLGVTLDAITYVVPDQHTPRDDAPDETPAEPISA